MVFWLGLPLAVRTDAGKGAAHHVPPAVSFVGMTRPGSKGRAVDRTAISALRTRHPYRQGWLLPYFAVPWQVQNMRGLEA